MECPWQTLKEYIRYLSSGNVIGVLPVFYSQNQLSSTGESRGARYYQFVAAKPSGEVIDLIVQPVVLSRENLVSKVGGLVTIILDKTHLEDKCVTVVEDLNLAAI